MVKIIGENGSGKTKKLLIEAQNCYLLCKNPQAMREKAYAYGITNVKCEHYSALKQVIDADYYIDDLDGFLEFLKCDGYNLSVD